MRKACFLFLILILLSLPRAFAGGKAERKQTSTAEETDIGMPEYTQHEAPIPVQLPAEQTPEQPEVSRAEQVMRALSEAYPDRTGPAEFRDSDWAIQVYGEWFYYADGRLLPESLRAKAADYDPQPFYNYAAELPPWTPPSIEESERMKNMMASRRQHPAKRSQHFYDALWRAHNQGESWERVKQIRFLGLTVMVHYSIIEELSLVEEFILNEAKTNAAVKQWIDGLKSIDGWSWRNIAATASRSYHSYGAAIDLLPKSWGGLETYWQWAAEKNPEWWAVPYTRRFHPPMEVVKAFEALGFLWGGKWMTYDTMHFEYRPEILLLSNVPQADLHLINSQSLK
ncbi:M15 family metallopeptidase [Leadbettera azotonutricia]|nr:M15 family metallopeptidase [Leadbettera azotonutricia]